MTAPVLPAAPTGLWQVEGVPAFQDNYLWVIHDGACAILVDPGDGDLLVEFLRRRRLALTAILCTHHHADHIGGIATLQAACGPVPVYGPAEERLTGLTDAVRDGDTLTLPAGAFTVLEVPAHTRSHIAWCWRDHLFCGDALFALGCGRLFEGTPAQLHAALTRFAGLPGEWWVHCAHEYTLSNLAFALTVDPDNPHLQRRAVQERARRAVGRPTVPSLLSSERATNPFLRTSEPAVRTAAERWAGQPLADAVAVTGALRAWKDRF